MLSKTHRVTFEPFDGAAYANPKFRGEKQKHKWVGGFVDFDNWKKPDPVRIGKTPKGDVIDISEPF